MGYDRGRGWKAKVWLSMVGGRGRVWKAKVWLG